MPQSSSTIHTKPPPAIPRLSASCVIVNAQNEILLVQRNPKARSFGGVHVFPGGNYDVAQDSSLAMTAIRETFEESGLLLASSKSPSQLSDSLLDEARKVVHSQKTLFTTFLSEHALHPDIASLLPFTQWITPLTNPRRFHTQFFVTFIPSASSLGFSSGDHQQRLPTNDGGQEVISARFIHYSDALAECRAGHIALMPPQFYILTTLAECLEGRESTPAQREKVRTLAEGAFGRMVINPRSLAPQGADGRVVLTYEGDETRGGRKGRLHRSLVRFGEGGLPMEVILQRNFDVFTEIESHVFSPPMKL